MEIVKIYTVKQHGIHPLKQTRHMDISFQAILLGLDMLGLFIKQS